MTEDPQKPVEATARRKSRLVPILAGVAFVIAASGAVLYGIGKPDSKEAAADAAKCAPERDVALRLKPFVHGEVAALSLNPAPKSLPDLTFNGPDGEKTSLAAFKGRLVLLNLWATWCVPCRQEMPSLDRLEANLGSDGFEVVAVNMDTSRLEKAKAFFGEIGVEKLGFYADPKADVFQVLKQKGGIMGLPTTILVGKDGCEIGTMAGPAKWDSPEAAALITAAAK
ncbi:thiol:disulfide interchange protein TlpA [Methyloferula stellata]|uniref:thiol:disulfide interchange protein TlpA n=1 Tax=Methyloferula stellata TaxID=876270 RepID=UPI00037701B0|nr:TlpA disulfide reductase family protein [Methyloferula stellata]